METDPDTAKQLDAVLRFLAPLAFESLDLRTPRFSNRENSQTATGTALLELAQGNRLYGEIRMRRVDEFLFRTRTLRLTVLRSAVTNGCRCGTMAPQGTVRRPGAVDQWETGRQQRSLAIGGGQLRTESENVDRVRNIELPIARIEIELSCGSERFSSWPSVSMRRLGTNRDSAAFRIEVWDDEFVVVAELRRTLRACDFAGRKSRI